MKPTLYAILEAALAVAMGVDHLFNAVFFRHVRKAAATFHDARGRVVEEHDEAGVAVMPFIMLFNRQIAYEISLVILKQFLNKRSTMVR